MAQRRGGGRAAAYRQDDRQRFAELIRQFGARGARERLARSVCMGTLLKIASEYGIVLRRGRRPLTLESEPAE
jgi:hypothetical protein